MPHQSKETLIRECFEMSQAIGFRHFLADNFHRPDAVQMRPDPEARKLFLREWWDAARERMYDSYVRDVAGPMSDAELLQQWHVLKEATGRLPANDNGFPQNSSDQHPAPGNEQGLDDRLQELRHQLTSHTADCDRNPEHTR